MTPEQSQIVTALNYLTGGLVIQDGTCPVSDTATLQAKLKLATLDDAVAYEADLVDVGLMVVAPGYFNTPRYYITDAGRAFIVMSKSSARAWTSTDVFNRIPESVFSGNVTSIQIACFVLVDAGFATTGDLGTTFVLS